MILPQSHFIKARTNSNYSDNLRNFYINSEKYVFYYFQNISLKKSLVENGNFNFINIFLKFIDINYLNISLEAKFFECKSKTFSKSFTDQNFIQITYSNLLSEFYNGIGLKGMLKFTGTIIKVEKLKKLNFKENYLSLML